MVAVYAQETSNLVLKASAFEVFLHYASVPIVLSSYLLHPADLVGLFFTEKGDQRQSPEIGV